jgi:hypothetical protein
MSRSTVRRIVIRTAAMAAIAGTIVIGPVSQAQAGGGDGNWRPTPGRAIPVTQ